MTAPSRRRLVAALRTFAQAERARAAAQADLFEAVAAALGGAGEGDVPQEAPPPATTAAQRRRRPAAAPPAALPSPPTDVELARARRDLRGMGYTVLDGADAKDPRNRNR